MALSTTLVSHFSGVFSNLSLPSPRQEPSPQTSVSWSALTGEATPSAQPCGRGEASFPPGPCTPRGASTPKSSPCAGPSLTAVTSRGNHAPSSHYIPNLPFLRPSLGGPRPFVPLITWQRGAFALIGGNKWESLGLPSSCYILNPAPTASGHLVAQPSSARMFAGV